MRIAGLIDDGFDESKLPLIMEIDEEDGIKKNGVNIGQWVKETMPLSDFFVRNDQENYITLQETLQRYMDILFGIGVNTPTQDESAMLEASSAAVNSACLSRQVGAVICSADGELIGIGANDVPRFGGGLYGEKKEDALGKSVDHRCFNWGKRCHNDENKQILYTEIHRELKNAGLLLQGVAMDAVIAAIKNTRAKDIIEYSRAVHAEMEAIVSVARGHKAGIVGGSLYTTVFPCHSCARHIIASGIRRVIYVEPYAKSLAMELHKDAISVHVKDQNDHVLFLQYEGVAPKNVLRLFRAVERKDKTAGGVVITKIPDDPKTLPLFASPLDSFSIRERLVVFRVDQLEHEGKAQMVSNPTAHGRSARKSA